MSWFEDLSPYSYRGPEPGTINIGWLDARHTFPTGDANSAFARRLISLCNERRVNVTRGWHICDLCSGLDAARGDAEIRVEGRDGTKFAAPTLIGHYVLEHRYQPPDAFIEAVMADPWVSGTP